MDDVRVIAQVKIDTWRDAYRALIPAAALAAQSVVADAEKTLSRLTDRAPGSYHLVGLVDDVAYGS